MKGYDKFSFKERKKYEETFVLHNSKLIQDITGASNVFNISQSPLDKSSGIDAILQYNTNLSGIALRIRNPNIQKISSIHLQLNNGFNYLFEFIH